MAPETELAFQDVVDAFAGDPDVAVPGAGSRFGDRHALKVNDKIFAMLSSKGEFVVKLPAARVLQLVGDRTGAAFDPGHGRVMKQWLVVKAGHGHWRDLAMEARVFAGLGKTTIKGDRQ